MIRIPEIGQAGNPQINAPTVRAGAAMAPTAALGGIVEALAGVGDHYQHLADQERKLINAQAESEARNQLATEFANFQLEMEKEQDPAKRIEMGRAFFAQSKGIAEKEGLAPIVRDSLRLHVDDFATRGMIYVTRNAAALQEQKTSLALQNEINMARDAGDRNAAAGAVARGVDAGVILPEKGEAIMGDIDQDIQINLLQAGVDADPRGVLLDLETEDFGARFPNVPVAMLPKIRKAAEASIQKKRGEELDLMEEALEAGKLLPQDLEGAEYLEPGDIAKVKAAIDASRPLDTKVYSEAWNQAFQLNKLFKDPGMSDEEYVEKYHNERARILEKIPPQFQGDLKTFIRYRSPAYRHAGEPDKRPDAGNKEFESMAMQRAKKAYDDGLLGDITDSKSESAKIAYSRFEDARLEIARWVKDHPEATYPEVREATSKILGGTLEDVDGGPVIPAVPPAVSFDTKLNGVLGLPAGAGGVENSLLPPR